VTEVPRLLTSTVTFTVVEYLSTQVNKGIFIRAFERNKGIFALVARSIKSPPASEEIRAVGRDTESRW
jgi:hypothetical protein